MKNAAGSDVTSIADVTAHGLLPSRFGSLLVAMATNCHLGPWGVGKSSQCFGFAETQSAQD